MLSIARARLGGVGARSINTLMRAPRTGPVVARSALGSSYGGSRLAIMKPARASSRQLSAVPKGEAEQAETVFERQVREAKADFKVFMTKERQPLKFMGLNSRTTIGMLCGHASFGIAALVYFETDPLTTRVMVFTGATLGLFFSYYRHPPLIISIKWLTLTLILNSFLLAILWNERAEAEELKNDPEKARIFEELFMPFDLNPVEFLRLMDLADRRVWMKGNDICQAGRPHEDMFLIVEGTAEVKSEGETVSHLEPGGFVGSMAFQRFTQDAEAPVDVTPDVVRRNTINSSDFVYLDNIILENGSSVYGGGDGRSTRKIVKEAFLHFMRQDHVIGKVTRSLVSDVMGMRVHKDDMERSKTTVTATSDVVTYAWDMHELHAFLKRRPLIAASLQKAMAEDFINKVYQSRGHEERYRLLLVESLDPGSINPIGREKLRRYRETHHISDEVHKGFLKEQGWTEEEYFMGFQQNKAPRDGSARFLEYEALVSRELAGGKVTPEARSNLRKFRSQAHIDAQEHLLAIQKQGWTADDYEAGEKGAGEYYEIVGNAADKFQ
ncbi:unnamed protein product [Ectocarpus sp. CCAP 1310/34]|nr:unnamed protein product [Ectocarpus sp. CCAP 1310/34]